MYCRGMHCNFRGISANMKNVVVALRVAALVVVERVWERVVMVVWPSRGSLEGRWRATKRLTFASMPSLRTEGGRTKRTDSVVRIDDRRLGYLSAPAR